MIVDGRAVEGATGSTHAWLGVEIGTLKLFGERVEIACKTLARVKKLIEATDEGFVVGAHAAGDGFEAGLHLVGVFIFQVVVDENDHRKGKSVGGKDVDILLDAILEDAKVFALKAIEELAFTILDGDGQDNQVRIDRDSRLGVAQWSSGRLAR